MSQINYYMELSLIHDGNVILKHGTNIMIYCPQNVRDCDDYEFNLCDEFPKSLMSDIKNVMCKIQFVIVDVFDQEGYGMNISTLKAAIKPVTEINDILSKIDELIVFVEEYRW